jgi:pimeloyl-ACP methyl ester carboxylesterase
MAVQKARCGTIELAYETFGPPEGSPMVLVMGLATQMLAWPDEFCHALAEAGFRVVRFDNRDVGLSTHLDDAGTPDLSPVFTGERVQEAPYTLADMAADTVGLFDALGMDRVHLVGASMGGMIAQEVAIRNPKRLRSLTLMMSSPSPHIGAALPEASAALFMPPPTSAEEAGQRTLAVLKVIGSPGYTLDEDLVTARGEESFRRANDPAGVVRQLVAIHASGDRTEQLGEVEVPTLVIHGAADPLVQPAGGAATAEAIPDARLVTYPGMGHDLPRPLWPAFVEEITSHARASEETW